MTKPAVYADDWLTTDEALAALSNHFRTKSALAYHLSRRSKNGLMDYKAIRRGPLGRLVINPARFHAWMIADAVPKAA